MKVLGRLALFTLLAVLAGLAGLYFLLRQSLPRTEGEIALAGLSRPVEILRDAYGIPHIYAATLDDAHFALGYVHAQDRLWQMEMNRRVAAGRLAEILGAGALESDRFLRTLGVRRAAEASLKHVDADTRQALDAYAAGVLADTQLTRALVGGRLNRLDEDDGVGPGRQLARRAAAHAARENAAHG